MIGEVRVGRELYYQRLDLKVGAPLRSSEVCRVDSVTFHCTSPPATAFAVLHSVAVARTHLT